MNEARGTPSSKKPTLHLMRDPLRQRLTAQIPVKASCGQTYLLVNGVGFVLLEGQSGDHVLQEVTSLFKKHSVH